jgi:hypothetical protein
MKDLSPIDLLWNTCNNHLDNHWNNTIKEYIREKNNVWRTTVLFPFRRRCLNCDFGDSYDYDD